jgi:uncharacterized coiled-coil DUF342 family protein
MPRKCEEMHRKWEEMPRKCEEMHRKCEEMPRKCEEMHRKCEAMSMRVTTHVVNSVSGKTFGRF